MIACLKLNFCGAFKNHYLGCLTISLLIKTTAKNPFYYKMCIGKIVTKL